MTTTAFKRAVASNTETPFLTVRLIQAGLTGGELNFCQQYDDTVCTLEDDTVVTFEGGGCAIEYPSEGSGIQIQIENVSTRAHNELKAAKAHRRATGEQIEVEFRQYLPSDLTQPQGSPIYASAEVSQITATRASLRADKPHIQDAVFPFLRIDPDKHLGVKWSQ